MSSLYLQSGWGHHTRAPQLRNLGVNCSGVILSPQHISAERLAEAAGGFADVLVDPQAYVQSIPDGEATRHEEHGLTADLSYTSSAREIGDFVDQVFAVQQAARATRFVAPAMLAAGFRDEWSQLGHTLLASMIDLVDPGRVLAAVTVEAAAFASWDDVEIWMDLFSRRDVAGIYLIVEGTSQYPPLWDAAQLANVLRFIYRMSVVNQYEVIWGYSDLAGVFGLAAGATAMASGWHYSARRFTRGSWTPSSGGRQPRPRVLIPTLLHPIDAASVSERWRDAGVLEGLPAAAQQLLIEGEFDRTDSWTQHLSALSTIANNLGDLPLLDRVGEATIMLERAMEAVGSLDDQGIAIEPGVSARLGEFQGAMDRFIRDEL